MAFWSKKQIELLNPEIVAPISDALASISHSVEWYHYDEEIGGEQVLFIGEFAKIHVWANWRDQSGFASIMQPQTDPFELSNSVIDLAMLLDFAGKDSSDYGSDWSDKTRKMSLYGKIVSDYALPLFNNEQSFTPLLEFCRGYNSAYNHAMAGWFG